MIFNIIGDRTFRADTLRNFAVERVTQQFENQLQHGVACGFGGLAPFGDVASEGGEGIGAARDPVDAVSVYYVDRTAHGERNDQAQARSTRIRLPAG